MRVVVVAEYYPRKHDPVLGVWAHRQALAARDAGADVRVVVLNRIAPSKAALKSGRLSEMTASVRQPLHQKIDDLDVYFAPFIAPSRDRSYGSWGSWAAPSLAVALKGIRRKFPFDLLHAHYAAPTGDAVRRARIDVPLVISVHGGDVLAVPYRWSGGRSAVEGAFGHAAMVLANSKAIAKRSEELGARNVRVVHLGTDLPQAVVGSAGGFGVAASSGNGVDHWFRGADAGDTGLELVTVSHLVERKRHIDVLNSLKLLQEDQPDLRWTIVGDGREGETLSQAAVELGLSERVHFSGQLPPREAVAAAQRGKVFVLPSVDEAFGVAYIEAMAGGVPVIGCEGEAGPEEIAALGGGMRLVPAREPEAIAAELQRLLKQPELYAEVSSAARANVAENFTWERCGESTVAAYRDVLNG